MASAAVQRSASSEVAAVQRSASGEVAAARIYHPAPSGAAAHQAAVDDMEEGEIAGLSPLGGGAVDGMEEGEMVESRPSHSHCNCKMDGKNQSDGGWKKGNSFIEPRTKSRIRNCYNCKEPGHFADDCPYENKDDKLKYVKKGNSIIKPRKKSPLRYCYNCKEPGHFADDCPYEERDDKPRYVKKSAKPNLLPNPLNKKKKYQGS